MIRQLTSMLVLPFALAVSAPIAAQCGGTGNISLEIFATGNGSIGPNTEITIRVTGPAGHHVCLACDFGAGPTDVPGVGTVCLDLSPNLLELVFLMPASGVQEFTATVPNDTAGMLLCCTAIGIDSSSPNGIGISNSVCFEIGDECLGGVTELGHITRFSDVTSFPVTVASGATGRAGGSGSPSTSVDYDPNNAPTFPVDGGNGVFIENIVRDGDDLLVTTLIRASPNLQHRSQGDRLPNELSLSASAGDATNTATVHTSCSQPLAVGLVFGEFRITNLTFRR